MKRQLLLLTATLLVLLACRQKEKRTIAPSEKLQQKEIEKTVVEEQYLQNDSLLNTLDAAIQKLVDHPKFTIRKELVSNRHVDNLIDTIRVFTFDKTTLQSYKSTNEEWIFDAKILNPEFELSNSIKTGIRKEVFEKALDIEVRTNRLRITDVEELNAFIFSFKDGILTEIEYEGYLD